VVLTGAGITLAEDWLEGIGRYREIKGEVAAEIRDREANKRRRLEHMDRLAGRKARRRPMSEAEIEARATLDYLRQQEHERKRFKRGFGSYLPDRETWRIRRAASGEVGELERVTVRPLQWFYAHTGQIVETAQGYGRLWQAFSDRVGVVLDDKPDQVTFMCPADVIGGVEEVS
jgi:hypothetical protein